VQIGKSRGLGDVLFPAIASVGRNPRVLLSRSSWARTLALLGGRELAQTSPATAGSEIRIAVEHHAAVALANFLESGTRLGFADHPAPVVSVVIVVWNRAALTLRCLRSVSEQTDLPIETIVVDNGSTDETEAVLNRTLKTRIVRTGGNLGFTMGA